MATMAERAVAEMPLATRAHVLEEGARSPSFWLYFTKLASSGSPGRAVDDDMKRALINELDPARHRHSAGRWPVLRQRMRDSLSLIREHYEAHGNLDGLAAALGQEESGVPGIVTSYDQEPMAPAPMPAAVPRDITNQATAAPAQWVQTPAQPAPAPSTSPSIWATIGSAVAQAGQAAAKIYASNLTARTQQSVAATQQRTAAQVSALRAQTAGILGGGAGSWIMYALLGLLGMGALVMLFKVLRKKR